MQTFLPFENFAKSAKSLDSLRLGKQRVEVKQLLLTTYWPQLRANFYFAKSVGVNVSLLVNEKYGRFGNHPALKMWEDYLFALMTYGIAICDEWIARGNADNVKEDLLAFAEIYQGELVPDQDWLRENAPSLLPPWLGDPRLHDSHKSNLMRKDPIWYGEIQKWVISPDLEYFWPGEDYVAHSA